MQKDWYLAENQALPKRRKTPWWKTEHAGRAEWPLLRIGRQKIENPSAEGNENLSGEKKADARELPFSEQWLAKRGHLLSFAGLFLFTAVLYFRPYEVFASLSGLTSLAFWIAAATVAVFIPSQLGMEGNFTARPREVNLVLALTLAAILSIPLAIDPAEAWGAFSDSFIKVVLMFIVMINVVRTGGRLRVMLLLSLAVGCVLSYCALRDYQSGNLTIEGYRVGGAIGGMFGNPNDMALYLVTITPIAVGLAFASRNFIARLLYIACALLLIGGNMVTYSRGGFLGLLAVLFMLSWKIGRRNRVAITVVCFLGTLVFIAAAPGGYGSRLLSIFLPGLDGVGSSSARKELLFRSLWVAARHPLLGIGMNNFHIVSIKEHVSHNAYTQVAAELGLTALVCYILFMVLPVRALSDIQNATFEGGKEDREYFYLAAGIQAAIIGYMVSSFFASVAYIWYVYYLVGFAIALRRIYYVKRDTQAAVAG